MCTDKRQKLWRYPTMSRNGWSQLLGLVLPVSMHMPQAWPKSKFPIHFFVCQSHIFWQRDSLVCAKGVAFLWPSIYKQPLANVGSVFFGKDWRIRTWQNVVQVILHDKHIYNASSMPLGGGPPPQSPSMCCR